jgi:hypothetical protein
MPHENVSFSLRSDNNIFINSDNNNVRFGCCLHVGVLFDGYWSTMYCDNGL